jgi:hypothetical protein
MDRSRIVAVALTAALITAVAVACSDDDGTASGTASGTGADQVVGAEAPFTIPDKSQARVAAYWTPERMRAAVPFEPAPDAASAEGRAFPSDQTACVRSAESCSNGNGAYAYVRGPGDPGTAPGRMVGKVFFSKSGKPYACSASVVASRNRSVVWTAGHCVASRGTFHSNWIFVPGYADGAAPQGRWVPRAGQSSFTIGGWLNDGDGRYDLAAVVLATDGGATIADRVGSLGIAFDRAPAEDDPVVILGYPGEPPFDGSDLKRCEGRVAERDEPPYMNGSDASTTPDTEAPSGYRVGCDLTGGASGGPFLIDTEADGSGGFVISVVSSGPVTVATGSYQGSAARDLWDAAQAFGE